MIELGIWELIICIVAIIIGHILGRLLFWWLER